MIIETWKNCLDLRLWSPGYCEHTDTDTNTLKVQALLTQLLPCVS